ncbi:MAG: GNAT family N-acetyltransferase [Clostridiales bacterium]|nr:GNAT family N-acetyltransferase [Clostridiales bacterium]
MFTFREITQADDAAVARLVRSNLEQVGLDIHGTAYFDAALDHLSTVYGRADSKYYVMLNEKGTVVGGIGFARFTPFTDTAELQKLYLADEEKGAGLGYQMISFIEARMREAGYLFSYLETHDALKAALHIYRKIGYQEIERPKEVAHSTMTRFFIKKL